MFSKVFFTTVVALLVAQAMGERALCPDPETANVLVLKQKVEEVAPEFGRVEKEYFIPAGDAPVTCITLTGGATGSVTSVGLSENGISIKIVSGILQGFDAELDVYTK